MAESCNIPPQAEYVHEDVRRRSRYRGMGRLVGRMWTAWHDLGLWCLGVFASPAHGCCGQAPHAAGIFGEFGPVVAVFVVQQGSSQDSSVSSDLAIRHLPNVGVGA